ncbi:hypothetical protein KP509_22G026300 [Ceratopteris richardii]|uniref:Uncharacterized protein n=1 Tax=Ceratopteris richardii TaxID=49495 RepID=A0A8T2S3L3_CERRI|nr:hypothetical protein KP509_22G026300 [Ceratopteris richardii]
MQALWARRQLFEKQIQEILVKELASGGFEESFVQGFKELVKSVGTAEAVHFLKRKPLPEFDPRRIHLMSKPGQCIHMPTKGQSSRHPDESRLISEHPPESPIAKAVVIIDFPPQPATSIQEIINEIPTTSSEPPSSPVHLVSPVRLSSPPSSLFTTSTVVETIIRQTPPTLTETFTPSTSNLIPPTPINPFLNPSFPSFPLPPRPMFPFPPPMTFSPMSPPCPTHSW